MKKLILIASLFAGTAVAVPAPGDFSAWVSGKPTDPYMEAMKASIYPTTQVFHAWNYKGTDKKCLKMQRKTASRYNPSRTYTSSGLINGERYSYTHTYSVANYDVAQEQQSRVYYWTNMMVEHGCFAEAGAP